MAKQKSKKDFIATLLLCFFLGNLGVHRFYVGKVWTGILMLITFGGFGIWYIIDFIVIVIGRFTDKKGLYIQHG
jgi:TM2 domain-containing membrane protein YozV